LGTFKLNFNGASKGNSRLVDIGCLFKNVDGEVIVAFTKDINVQTSQYGKAKETHIEICHAYEKNIFPLIIEGDSKNILY